MPTPSFDKPILVWDTEQIFRSAGGGAALRRLLVTEGFPTPRIETVYMWRNRGRIPHRWIPMVVYALLTHGKAKLSELLSRKTVDPADLVHAGADPDEDD